MSMYVPEPTVPIAAHGQGSPQPATRQAEGGTSTDLRRTPLWGWRSTEQKVRDAREDSVNDAGAIEILRSEGVKDPEAALANYSVQHLVRVRVQSYDPKRVRYLAATRLRREVGEGTRYEHSDITRALKEEGLWETLRNNYGLEDYGVISYRWDRKVLEALDRYIDDPNRVPADLAGPTSVKPFTAEDAAAIKQREELAQWRADQAELGEILTESFIGALSYGERLLFTNDPHDLLQSARLGAAAEGVIGALGAAVQNRGTYSPRVVGSPDRVDPYGSWRYRGPAPTKPSGPVSSRGKPPTVAPPSWQTEAGPPTVAPAPRVRIDVKVVLESNGAKVGQIQVLDIKDASKVRLDPKERAVYVLRESNGEIVGTSATPPGLTTDDAVLKVGRTKSTESAKGRFGKYRTAGESTGKELTVEVYPIEMQPGRKIEYYEKAVRSALKSEGHDLPRDHTERRGSGFGTPGEGKRYPPITRGEMEELLREHQGNVSEVARELGGFKEKISDRTVQLWAQNLGLRPADFRPRRTP
jgi:hypothetical protein